MDKQDFRRIVAMIAERSPFWAHLGITVESIDDGCAALRMAASDKLSNAGGVVHGGALAALADSCVAIAVLSLCTPEERVSTIEMKINYLEPAQPGECRCTARILRRGGTTAVGDVDILDCRGRLVAKSLVTYAIFKAERGSRIADVDPNGAGTA